MFLFVQLQIPSLLFLCFVFLWERLYGRYFNSLVIALSSWFFADGMANLRPQNLPLSAIYRKFHYFSWNNLSFHHLLTQMGFRSDKVPGVSIVPFFHFHTIVLNLPVCFKLIYWNLPSRCLTLKLSFVYFQFYLRDDWRCYLYRLLLMSFSICFCCRRSFPCTWLLIRYGRIPCFRSFSIYNLVFSDRWRRLSKKKIQRLWCSSVLTLTIEFLMNILCN